MQNVTINKNTHFHMAFNNHFGASFHGAIAEKKSIEATMSGSVRIPSFNLMKCNLSLELLGRGKHENVALHIVRGAWRYWPTHPECLSHSIFPRKSAKWAVSSIFTAFSFLCLVDKVPECFACLFEGYHSQKLQSIKQKIFLFSLKWRLFKGVS